MKYLYKAHPTRYKGVLFRSRLEARYAAFFDLVGWKWEYEPIDLVGWTPDFLVIVPCGHSECGGRHELLVEVKPYNSIEEFSGHHCMRFPYGFNDREDGTVEAIPADASAAFGIHPRVSWWEMGHGSGGGEEEIENWIPYDANMEELWNEAGNLTRYLVR